MSFERWKRVPKTAYKIFNLFSLILTSNLTSKRYFEKLGGKNIFYLGNIKYSNKIDFKIKPLHKPYSNDSYTESVNFWQEVDVLRDKINNLSNKIKTTKNKINLNLKAYEKANLTDEELHTRLIEIRERNLDVEQKLNGSKSRSEIGEKNEFPTIWNYLWAAYGSSRSTYGPNQTHKESLQNASTIHDELKSEVDIIIKLFVISLG